MTRLKGHERSRLDGEHGLAAATMRDYERLLELETCAEAAEKANGAFDYAKRLIARKEADEPPP